MGASSSDTATQLVRYHVWATRRLASAVESLSPDELTKNYGGSFGSIHATLKHMLEADFIWLNRLKGTPTLVIPSWTLDTGPALLQQLLAIQDELVAAIATASQEIQFTTRTGNHVNIPLLDVVLQLSHHGSYHRGQVSNMLRTSGYQPPATDYFIFSMSNLPR